jgi:hypothetical protein
MPTNTRRDSDPQSDLLSTVRESQAAIVDVVRSWTDVSQRFTRGLPLPVAGVDIASFVDRVFDLAEQTLAAQRQLALALAGVATRQADIAVETIDTAVETTVRASAHPVEERIDAPQDEQAQRDRERPEQPQAGKGAAPKDEPRKQDSKPDRRGYEERSIEELRDRARELEIEGRSSMSKDELVAALRDHRQPRAAKGAVPKDEPRKQDSKPDRRSYEERSIEELRDRARELEIEGRSSMSKDELVAALRKHSK